MKKIKIANSEIVSLFNQSERKSWFGTSYSQILMWHWTILCLCCNCMPHISSTRAPNQFPFRNSATRVFHWFSLLVYVQICRIPQSIGIRRGASYYFSSANGIRPTDRETFIYWRKKKKWIEPIEWLSAKCTRHLPIAIINPMKCRASKHRRRMHFERTESCHALRYTENALTRFVGFRAFFLLVLRRPRSVCIDYYNLID